MRGHTGSSQSFFFILHCHNIYNPLELQVVSSLEKKRRGQEHDCHDTLPKARGPAGPGQFSGSQGLERSGRWPCHQPVEMFSTGGLGAAALQPKCVWGRDLGRPGGSLSHRGLQDVPVFIAPDRTGVQ